MIAPTATTERTEAIHRHLAHNAASCLRHNIIVRVDSINADQTVALCSVGQRTKGILRRQHSMQELIWRAEQALAPLNSLGVLPMINVLHEQGSNTTAAVPSRDRSTPFDWIRRLRGWLGYPPAHGVFDTVTPVSDPFGWRMAMQLSIGK